MSHIVFIGMEEIGWHCLDTLLKLKANIAVAFTLPTERASDIVAYKSFENFIEKGLPVEFVEDINDQVNVEKIKRIKPDIIYQIGWSQLLSPELLSIPHYGVVGMHCSLLPKHRGRAPIPWSIIFGLRRSGMTLFYLDARADKGGIIGQVSYDIESDDYAYDVYRKACNSAVELIETYHLQLIKGTAVSRAQDSRYSDYWPKRTPQDGLIDWDQAAPRLYDWVRALSRPFPGAFTFWRGRRLWIWRAAFVPGEAVAPSGTVEKVENQGVLVSAGRGKLLIQRVQLEGEDEQDASHFAGFHYLKNGDVLGEVD